MRAAVGVTYAEMAAHSKSISQATLKRIASADGGVPKWDNVDAYYTICFELAQNPLDLDVLRAKTSLTSLRRLWVKARKEERGTLGLRAPRLEFVRDTADLSYALYVLYEDSGAPPLRELQRNAGGPVYMPLTTAARIVGRQALPADTSQFMAFLKGCAVSKRNIKVWRHVWYRVMSREAEKQEAPELAPSEKAVNILSAGLQVVASVLSQI
jgi:hypothetical protein